MGDLAQSCPVCYSNATVNLVVGHSYWHISCPLCGQFLIELDCFVEQAGKFLLPNEIRSSLYYRLTQIEKNNRKEAFCVANQVTEFNNSPKLILLEDLRSSFPMDLYVRLNRILTNLSNLAKYVGNSFILDISNPGNCSHLFFLDTENDNNEALRIEWWKNTLQELGYLETRDAYLNGEFDLELTIEGWSTVFEFQKTTQKSEFVFVAMWFDKSMDGAREAIVRAIRDSKLIPVLIDAKEHNNQIVPEILFEIKRSRFVIADFTEQRGGVYFEAGFAEGLGIPVIALCNKSDFDNVHFDLKQKNTIVWQNEMDLYERLLRRIEVTLNS